MRHLYLGGVPFQYLSVLCIVFFLIPVSGFSQISFTWNEFFRQKKTETKYQLKAIAELQLYLEILKEGYKAASNGLETVRSIRNGEFDLHDIFYLSLKQVNPVLKKFPQALQIVERAALISTDAGKLLGLMHASMDLSPQQKNKAEQAVSALLDKVSQTTDDLLTVLVDYKLELSDDERIERISALFKENESQYLYYLDYRNQMAATSLFRSREAQEVISLRQLHTISN